VDVVPVHGRQALLALSVVGLGTVGQGRFPKSSYIRRYIPAQKRKSPALRLG
jgi:hypothetical protein